MPSDNIFPTDEQRAVLESENRITLVKAAPGSGKTRVFSEFIKIRIGEFKDKKNGIAALSFTNAASDEIADRVGSDISAPHFVGTLDSFLFKFVIKPFGHLFELSSKGITILPPVEDRTFGSDDVQVGATNREQANVFSIRFAGGTVASPILIYKNSYGKNQEVHSSQVRNVLGKKQLAWKNRGVLTHSDCQYLAAKMLSDPAKGPEIIKILAKKFPWILVDEFQDTGTFLSISLKQILDCQEVKSLIVGDPDQSVFEFSGANPENFTLISTLDGARQLPLTITQRCPKKVAKAAEFLSCTESPVQAKQNAEEGNLVIIPHNLDTPRLDGRILSFLEELEGDLGSLTVLARRNKEVRGLRGDYVESSFVGSSNAARSLFRAVEFFRCGEITKAFTLSSNVVGRTLYKREILNRNEAVELAISWQKWRGLILQMLVNLEQTVTNETWNAWVARAKSEVKHIANALNIQPQSLGQKFRSGGDDGDAVMQLVQVQPLEHPVMKGAKFKNIHEAKGTEADTVVLYLPKYKAQDCISISWFQGTLEERRVGFVALTRAKKNLVLYAHAETIGRLQAAKIDFASLFTVVT